MRVLILGAGGHAQVVADILVQMQHVDPSLEILGYVDDNPALLGLSYLGFPVLGQLAQIATIGHDRLALGIGSNPVRRRLYDRFVENGEQLITACHPSAVIGCGVSIGPGTVICARVVVSPGARIGANVILNTGCTVDHHNNIGDHVHIAPGCHLGGDVSIGTGTLVGIGATILPQRHVGDWSIVGAGAVVTRDVPSGATVAGVPARLISKS